MSSQQSCQCSGYCMRCKTSVTVSSPQEKVTVKGQNMLSGTCPHCATKVNRFVSVKQLDTFRAASAGSKSRKYKKR
jgi:phage FluMu protein Com